jgi:hypothetical protein
MAFWLESVYSTKATRSDPERLADQPSPSIVVHKSDSSTLLMWFLSAIPFFIAICTGLAEIHLVRHVWRHHLSWAKMHNLMSPQDMLVLYRRDRVNAFHTKLKAQAPEIMDAKAARVCRLLVLWGPWTAFGLAILCILVARRGN